MIMKIFTEFITHNCFRVENRVKFGVGIGRDAMDLSLIRFGAYLITG